MFFYFITFRLYLVIDTALFSSFLIISVCFHNVFSSVSKVTNDSFKMSDQWLRNRSHDIDSITFDDVIKFFETRMKKESTIFVNDDIRDKFYINMKFWRDLISIFRKYINVVLAKLVLRLSQKIFRNEEIDFFFFSSWISDDFFHNRSWSQFSFIIVDVLKFLEIKLSKKWTISLNNDTSDRVYLNVKMFDDLISLLSNRIDKILIIIRFIIVDLEFFEDWKFSKNEQVRQIQLKYLKISVIHCQATEEIIEAIRQIAQKSTRQTKKHINEQISNSSI